MTLSSPCICKKLQFTVKSPQNLIESVDIDYNNSIKMVILFIFIIVISFAENNFIWKRMQEELVIESFDHPHHGPINGIMILEKSVF